ncbi:MAG: DUF1819 family protein [Anaerolineales bacterium]|nr:DUF1819 family protein [Anaerolineales bacterium]
MGNDTRYSSKIIKAGALLADTKTFLAYWDESASPADNLQKARRNNIFGKASRSRVEDILIIFKQRYLMDENVTRALATLVKNGFQKEALDRILYFHACQSDLLLHDAVTDLISSLYNQGRQEVNTVMVESWIREKIEQGKTRQQWSDITIKRSAQEILSTLRDFSVLQGAAKKTIASTFLPIEAFAYVAMYLKQYQPSGQLLIEDPEWQLFFLERTAVERFFMEAHQHRLLRYDAAGSIVRITFPVESLEDYASVIVERTY